MASTRQGGTPSIGLDELIARSASRSAARMEMSDLVARSSSRSAGKLLSARSGELAHNPHIFSRIYPDFLLENPELNLPAERILDRLLLSSSTGPCESGGGIKLSADTPFNAKIPTINVERVAYLRNIFGRNCTTHSRKIPSGCEKRFAYGTGNGMTTHGIPHR